MQTGLWGFHSSTKDQRILTTTKEKALGNNRYGNKLTSRHNSNTIQIWVSFVIHSFLQLLTNFSYKFKECLDSTYELNRYTFAVSSPHNIYSLLLCLTTKYRAKQGHGHNSCTLSVIHTLRFKFINTTVNCKLTYCVFAY